MSNDREKVIELAAALRGEAPRKTAEQAAEMALRRHWDLTDDDGIYGTSPAAEAMGFHGRDEDADIFDAIKLDVAGHIANVPGAVIRIEFAQGAVEVTPTGDDLSDLMDALAASDALKPILAAIGEDSYHREFDTWDDISKRSAQDIASAFLEGGFDAVQELIQELAIENGPDAYVRELSDGSANNSPFDTAIDAIHEAWSGIDEEADVSEIREAFCEAFDEELCEAVADADDSVAIDVIPSHARIEVVNILTPIDGPDLHPDELIIEADSSVCAIGSMRPGLGLKALLERTNISVADFMDAVEAKEGIRLDAGADNEELVRALAEAADLSGKPRDHHFEEARRRAEAWSRFEARHDPEAPAVVSMDDLLTMLTESSYGGTPVFVARMPLKEFVSRDWSEPMRPTADDRYGPRNRTGGFMGVYHHGNGSGYIEQVDSPPTLAAGTDMWRVSGRWGYEVDDVFGIVGTAYYAEPTSAPAPELESEVSASPRM